MYNYNSYTEFLSSDLNHNVIKKHNKITIGKYYCNLCKKYFKRKDNLKRHNISIHFKEKKYLCIYCNKKYVRNEDLNHHLKKLCNKILQIN